MHILNFLIIPVILVSLVFGLKFSYLISLFCSLGAATFIYRQYSLINILLTIALFNLTPLFCRHFNLNLRKGRLALESKKTAAKTAYEQILKKHSLLREANLQLNKEASEIAELYRMTRDMSAVLSFEAIFDILGKKLMQSSQFKKMRLALIDEDVEAFATKEVFELKYAQNQASVVKQDVDDLAILKQALGAEKVTYIKEKSITLLPLAAGEEFLGALWVEDLPIDAGENFSILANQFCLEFRRVRLYRKIQKLAITDGLSGLFVRRYFLERLEEEIKRSARHYLDLSFLMIDLDHFKKCNDSFGHLRGDAVLREVSRIIKANVREIDLPARYGGEEFSVLLPDTDKGRAKTVAERIRASVDQHKFAAGGKTFKMEVSIGVASFPEDATRLKTLIDKADQALYRAKQGGRNKVEIC